MVAKKYTIREAMKAISKLISEAESGNDVYITREGKPVVKVVPVAASSKKRVLGGFEGKISWTPDAFDPLTDEELKDWGLP